MLKANRARFGLHVRETDLLGNDFESFRTRVQNLEYQVGNHLGFWGIENLLAPFRLDKKGTAQVPSHRALHKKSIDGPHVEL